MDIIVKRTSALITDTDIVPVIAAFNLHMSRDFAPVWNAADVPLPLGASVMYLNEGPAGAHTFTLADTIDIAGALGYHVDESGTISAIIDVALCKQCGDDWRICLFHEGDEATADPYCNRMAPNGIDIIEPCDAVEMTSYLVDGVPASNFVLPAGFGFNAGTKYDFNGQMTKPVPDGILPGGYAMRLINGAWTNVMGERAPGRYMVERESGRRSWRKANTVL